MSCPICFGHTLPAGWVDFNKSCEDRHGPVFPPAGVEIRYVRCLDCGLLYAPVMCQWPPHWFKERIYNADYVRVDPDYTGARAQLNAASLVRSFGHARAEIRHLDYGGGDGALAALLQSAGFDSTSWDPTSAEPEPDGQFNLITAFEVFEHAPHPTQLRAALVARMTAAAVVVFSTLTSDALGSQFHPANWWYAAPRNGHVCLYTRRALRKLFYPIPVFHVSDGAHMAVATFPSWLEPSLQ